VDANRLIPRLNERARVTALNGLALSALNA
jgi:hypothetical protein